MSCFLDIKHTPKALTLKRVRVASVFWCGATIENAWGKSPASVPLKEPLQEWVLKCC